MFSQTFDWYMDKLPDWSDFESPLRFTYGVNTWDARYVSNYSATAEPVRPGDIVRSSSSHTTSSGTPSGAVGYVDLAIAVAGLDEPSVFTGSHDAAIIELAWNVGRKILFPRHISIS